MFVWTFAFERAPGAPDAAGRQGRGVGTEDEDGFGVLLEEPPGSGEHPLAELFSTLRDKPHISGKERFYEVQALRRGAGDGHGAEKAGLCDRVTDQGSLETSSLFGRKTQTSLRRAGHRGFSHDQEAGYGASFGVSLRARAVS